MKRNIKMTIREIALRAGVSIGTVDRVLHNRGRVSPETKAKIEGIIAQFGYRPNPIARHLKLKKEYTFFIFSPRRDEDSGYWNIIFQGIHRAADELSAFGIRIHFAEFDRYSRESFWKAARKIPLDACDGILLAPVVPAETSRWIHSFPPRLPYVFFDATLPDASPVTEIGQDPYSGGYLAGKLLALFSSKLPGTFCALSPHSEDFHIHQRIKGFLSYWSLQGSAFRTEVRTCEDMDHRGTRETFLQTLLKDIPSPRGIFVANASVHAVAEMVNRRNTEHIPIIGYDLVPDNERLLREGLIDVLISQRPEYQGYQAVYQLYRYVVLQQDIHPKIPVPIHIYMKENLLPSPSPDLEYVREAMV